MKSSIPTTLLTKVNDEIAERNRMFTKATKAQRRVLVAKDVIAQLKAGRFTAESGVWLIGDTVDAASDKIDPSLQRAVLAGQVECTCCALGSMMASCVLFKNKLKTERVFESNLTQGISHFYDHDEDVRALFSDRQICLIECFFEGGDGAMDYTSLTEREQRSAIHFIFLNENDNDRLGLIMRNIVKNQGTFKPRLYSDKAMNVRDEGHICWFD